MSPIGMPPSRPPALRRTALLALAGVTVLTSSACLEADIGTLHTRAGFTIESFDVPVSICPAEDESRFAEDEGTLIGAHFALQVECVASFDQFPEDFQLEYLFGEGEELFSPEPGYEFTMVQFAPEPTVEALFEPEAGAELTTKLTIGEQQWDLDGSVPVPGAVYLAVAEKDAPVQLEINDAERTQSIDMRERTRSGLIEALYTGSETMVNTDVVEHAVDARYDSSTQYWYVEDWTYRTSFTVSREVYDEDEGWIAEPDQARLSVSFEWLAEGNDLVWEIDPEAILKVTGPDGEMTADNVTEDEISEDDYVVKTYDLQFTVPADALAYTLDYHPAGEIEWPDEGISMPISNDKSHELSVDFT